MLNIKTFYFNPFQECTTLLWDETGEGVVVDPGCYNAKEEEELRKYISLKKIKLVAIWLTHAHPDHIFGVAGILDEAEIPVLVHPLEEPEAAFELARKVGLREPRADFETVDIHEGDTVKFGNTRFTVIETPGHTPGGVCYYDKADNLLITGDTLFAGSIGRTDLRGGDYDHLIVSIMNKLMGLPGETEIIPGHGETSDIGWERTHNPFLQPWGEPWEDNENAI
ncbi:MAG: MBL fold metallo-hydrolase [Bacteroidales bacterium]|nr:MBL fold metallo-hydrolase [Bacteroidales bacterium]